MDLSFNLFFYIIKHHFMKKTLFLLEYPDIWYYKSALYPLSSICPNMYLAQPYLKSFALVDKIFLPLQIYRHLYSLQHLMFHSPSGTYTWFLQKDQLFYPYNKVTGWLSMCLFLQKDHDIRYQLPPKLKSSLEKNLPPSPKIFTF